MSEHTALRARLEKAAAAFERNADNGALSPTVQFYLTTAALFREAREAIALADRPAAAPAPESDFTRFAREHPDALARAIVELDRDEAKLAAAPAPEGLDKEIDRAFFKLDDEIGFQIDSDTRGPTVEGERQYQRVKEILREFALRARPALSDEALRTFALEVLDGYRTGVVGDIDGGWLQDRALALGLLVMHEDGGDCYIADALTAPAARQQESG